MSAKKNPALLVDSNRASIFVKAASPDNVDNTLQCSFTQPNQCVGSSVPKQQDRIFLHLYPGWSLGFDQHQWIVLRAKKRRDESYWDPVAFIATKKRILLRVLAEKGIKLTPEATVYIERMPDTFREWLRVHSASQSCQCQLPVIGKTCLRSDAAQFGFSKQEPVQ
jgi:hypothetical protein